MKKYYCALAAVIAAAVIVLVLGSQAGIWEISSGSQGLLGLVAVLPAVIWIFFKGINLINVGLYIGGIDYILIKKFLPLGLSVALIVAEAVAVIACIMIIYTNKNKELEAAETEAETNDAETGSSEETDG